MNKNFILFIYLFIYFIVSLLFLLLDIILKNDWRHLIYYSNLLNILRLKNLVLYVEKSRKKNISKNLVMLLKYIGLILLQNMILKELTMINSHKNFIQSLL